MQRSATAPHTGLSGSRESIGEGSFRLLVALLVAITLARVLGLAISRAELFYDEMQYWAWGQDLAFGYFTKPPLLSWLMRAVTDLFGASTFSVRVLSPVIHLGTSLLIYALGTKLYHRRVGFWAALVYALTPGTSFSATLFTTDVPLLVLWSAALLALAYHAEKPRLSTGLMLGLAIGLGLNAKYMMIFLPACMLGWGLATQAGRRVLKAPSTWSGLGFGALLIVPNLVWNATHGFATFKHTQSDALWSRDFGHPGKMLEFIGAQFGILGPLLFAVFLYVVFWRKRTSRPDADRFLIWHSLPVLVLFTVQAFISRANGNWGAVAFPAAAVLVTAFVLERGMRRTLVASFAIAGLAFTIVTFSGVFAETNAPLLGKQFRRLVGYAAFGRDLKDLLDRTGVKTLVAEGRGMTSVVTWELRGTDYEIRAFLPPDTAPEDHYELTKPWNPSFGGPAVLVSTTRPSKLGIPTERAVEIGRTEHAPHFASAPLPIYRVD